MAHTHIKLEAINEVKKTISEFKLQINELNSLCYLYPRLYQTLHVNGLMTWKILGVVKGKKSADRENQRFSWVIRGGTFQRSSVLVCYLVEKLHFNSLVGFCFLSPSLSVHAYLFKYWQCSDFLHPFKGNSKRFNMCDALFGRQPWRSEFKTEGPEARKHRPQSGSGSVLYTNLGFSHQATLALLFFFL